MVNLQEEQLSSCTQPGDGGTLGNRSDLYMNRKPGITFKRNDPTGHSNKVSLLSKTHQKVFLNEHASVIHGWQGDRLRRGQ